MSWILLSLCPAMRAGDAEQGKVEAAVYGGMARFGDPYGTQAAVGVAVGYNAAGHLQLFGEFGYMPLGTETQTVSGVSATSSEKMIDAGGGALVSLLPRASRINPYVLGVAGDGHNTLNANASVAGYSVSAGTSLNSAYIGVGGGARIFIGSSWGLRPEVRFQRYLQNGGLNAVTVTFGLFFGFGK